MTSDEHKNLAKLIEQMSNSLTAELHEFRDEVRASVDRIDATTARQSRMFVGGTIALSGLTKAVTRLEAQMKARDTQMRELRTRLRKLEGKK